MRCPLLNELPPPPPGKTGWPWTEETTSLTDPILGGQTWPHVSIVTPSYNQGQFIEETIRSVLLQGYPNLEYVIIDGGSADNSVQIIRQYQSWLTYWVSESDRGQSEAINKGFARTTGSILSWLNSDDRLQPRAIQIAVKFFQEHPDVGVIYGDFNKIDESGSRIKKCKAPVFDLSHQIVRDLIPQPAAFFARSVWQQFGPLNAQFHYIMDYDFWTRSALSIPIMHFPVLMADVRFHDSSKTMGQSIQFMLEIERFFDEFFALPNLPPQVRALESQGRGANYFVMGRRYLKVKQYQQARDAFRRSWSTYPLHPNKLMVLPFWLDTILKTNIGMPLFRLVTWLKNGDEWFDE